MPDLLQREISAVTSQFILMFAHFNVDCVKKDLELQVTVKGMNAFTLELSRIHVLFVEKVFHSQVV